ncbi:MULTISPECIES: hypothetical protein [unclassified Halomonas]|uniref:hypothetical protein n=1 Tax=unclassified Halomonas TaxID=2609666 RepID=UPI000F665633|nr:MULTISPECIES: hypothetical protein [unclassified Halomonas]MBT2785499.1 hypothetical protein [Halomonas sp. ISL-106]MBT2797817.1 hypothetical protein [Halomonas sp. ISL-104]
MVAGDLALFASAIDTLIFTPLSHCCQPTSGRLSSQRADLPRRLRPRCRAADIAQRHQLPVLLANHVSTTGGWQTCGNSGGWNAGGEQTVKANGTQQCLVLCHIHHGALSGRVEVMTYPHYKESVID